MPLTASRDLIGRTDVAQPRQRAAARQACSNDVPPGGRGLGPRDTVPGRFSADSPSSAAPGDVSLRPGPLEMGDRVTDHQQPSERGAFAMFGTLTGIATLSAVLVAGGAALGLLVDSWTSAPHVFVFLGLVLGVVAAVLATRSIVGRFFR
jgi:hypothetical protein